MTLLAFILSCMIPMWVTDDVNVRTAPGFDGEIVDVLETGEEVKTLMTVERDRNWTIIETDDGLRAVCSDYLTDEEPEPEKRYYGNCRITFYDSCPSCCGKWAYGATASGVMPTPNHTVACGDLPFGTRLMIDGQEDVVEDRGVGAQQIDIFVNDHGEALDRGLYYTDVWILEG